MKFDELIVSYVGEFGTHQKIQFLLVCIPTILTAMHALSWTFTAADVLHRCRLPEENGTSNYWISPDSNLTAEIGGLLHRKADCNRKDFPHEECPFETCNKLGTDNSTDCPNGYIFDHSVVSYSAIERWEFVCDRQVFKAVIQSMYYVGQMIGSIVFGFLGDRIGRKKVFIIALMLQIVSGAGMAFVPHWTLFSILRIGVGFAHPGIFVIAVVIGMELMGPSKRKIASIVPGLFFAVGQMILGLLAYYIRNYQHLQAAIALPSLFFISYWWLIPESARWLISQKRYEEADKILQRSAKANGRTLPEKWWEKIDDFSDADDGSESKTKGLTNSNRKHNFLDLVRTRKMRLISLTIFFCWPVVSMIYYGMSMKADFLGGDLYLNFVFGAIIEVPSVLIVFFLLDKIGRRPMLAGGYGIAAICILSSYFINSDNKYVNMVQFLIGRGAITATYAVIYTFTPELFPTVIRNMATGICSMIARVGAILASFMVMFLQERYGKELVVFPFAILAILAAVASCIMLPETMGRELQETIDEVEGTVRHHEMQPLAQSNKLEDASKIK